MDWGGDLRLRVPAAALQAATVLGLYRMHVPEAMQLPCSQQVCPIRVLRECACRLVLVLAAGTFALCVQHARECWSHKPWLQVGVCG